MMHGGVLFQFSSVLKIVVQQIYWNLISNEFLLELQF